MRKLSRRIYGYCTKNISALSILNSEKRTKKIFIMVVILYVKRFIIRGNILLLLSHFNFISHVNSNVGKWNLTFRSFFLPSFRDFPCWVAEANVALLTWYQSEEIKVLMINNPLRVEMEPTIVTIQSHACAPAPRRLLI